MTDTTATVRDDPMELSIAAAFLADALDGTRPRVELAAAIEVLVARRCAGTITAFGMRHVRERCEQLQRHPTEMSKAVLSALFEGTLLSA